MRRIAGGRLYLIIMAQLCAALTAWSALAQTPDSTGVVAGEIRNAAGLGIAGAEITVRGTTVTTQSDVDGRFRLQSIGTGTLPLQIRRLGFLPATVDVAVQPGTTAQVAVTLDRVAQELAPVVVQERARQPDRRSAFERRREAGFGRFITREDIQRRNPMVLTDMLRMLPGVRVTGSGGVVGNRVYIRGNRCTPLVWLDGMPLTAGYFDIDVLSPQSIEGIEVYSGVGTVPAELMGPRGLGGCGVIAVWSRRGEPRRRRQRDSVTAAQLADAVAAASLYTADQVDTPVRVVADKPVQPVYPDSLYAAGVDGVVLVEFVVDTTGQVERGTFGGVTSTHPLFTESVRQAVAAAAFTPAVLRGRRVRQVVQLPVQFVLPPPPSAAPRQ